MPYIDVKVSVSLSAQQREAVKADLGKAIAIIPGKAEQYLMVNLDGDCNLYYQGNQSAPTAFAEVKLLGAAGREVYTRMTEAVCELFNRELGIPPERTYVVYTEYTHWGCNGTNF